MAEEEKREEMSRGTTEEGKWGGVYRVHCSGYSSAHVSYHLQLFGIQQLLYWSFKWIITQRNGS